MKSLIIFLSAFFILKSSEAQTVVGALKYVMKKGELEGVIHLDSIINKNHLFGMGPLEYLKGEITIFDGVSYVSKVADDNEIFIEKTFDVKAPFFAYEHISEWRKIDLAKNVKNAQDIEIFLDKMFNHDTNPFFFRIKGKVKKSDIHIVNLPDGTIVKSHDIVKKTKSSYQLTNEEVEILGFFSRKHQSIFTHHDTFIHLHLINNDKTKMGHVDEIELTKGAVLYLPVK